MNQTRKSLRIQVVKGRYRWGARFTDEPEVWFVGRSCSEALGRLFVANKGLFGVLLAGFVWEGNRHVPLAEPAMHGQLKAFLQESVEAKSLPPLWTVGPRGRDVYHSISPHLHKRPPEAA